MLRFAVQFLHRKFSMLFAPVIAVKIFDRNSLTSLLDSWNRKSSAKRSILFLTCRLLVRNIYKLPMKDAER